MRKFAAAFFAVPPGEIYPREYAVGEDCPAELEESAASVGAIDTAQEIDTGANTRPPAMEVPAAAPDPKGKGK